jgi:hypothetical protein
MATMLEPRPELMSNYATQVSINGSAAVGAFVGLNKQYVKTIRVLDEGPAVPSRRPS